MPSDAKSPLRFIRIVALIVVIGVVIWALLRLTGLSHGGSHTQYTNDAYVEADFTLVAPRIPGQISEVLVEDNEVVKTGQVLVRIDDRDYKAALASAEADVATEKASITNYEAEIAQQPSLVDQARATLKSDDASIAFAQQNAARYKNLSVSGAGTAEEQQHTSSTLAEQIAQRAHDQAALTTIEENLAILTTEREKAVGALARAQAVLDQARLNLSYTEIHAPIDGKVGRRSARVGAYVTPGTEILAVVPLSEAYVVANYQENQITNMRSGDSVRITVDSFPGVVIHGHINSLAPATGVAFSPIAPDDATGNFTKIVQRLPVKITIDPGQEAASLLSVGLLVETEIDVSRHRDSQTAAGDGK